jgi:hypothetical protein
MVLLGPILFIRDVAWENQATGVVACLLLAPVMLLPIFRPRPWSFGAAGLAAFAWLGLGIIGMGIDC